MKLEIICGDITLLDVDAIVNAANPSLLGGRAVDGAIHEAAGAGLLAECEEIRRTQYPEGLPTGKAVITGAYNLPARFVIHTVGPIYRDEERPAELLKSAYVNSLVLAEENHLTSIAFPAISTGSYGYPKEEALTVVNGVIRSFEFKSLQRVVLCFFSEYEKRMADDAFKEFKEAH